MANRLVAAAVLLCALLSFAHAQTEVYPGVYRFRFGTPERFTPVSMRVAPVSPALKRMNHVPLPGKFQMAEDALGHMTGKATIDGYEIDLPATIDDQYYGVGLNTALFRLNGHLAWSIPSDHPENDTNESHAPEPFFVSTAGYGVFLDTSRYASFDFPVNADMSGLSEMKIHIPHASGVDMYVFAGPTMLDAVRRYNLFSGGGCVPPLWGLGIAYRGQSDFTAQDALSLAKSFRDTHMPCDIFGVEPGWQTKTYSSSFVWNTKAFPDPDAFIRSLHELGYRTSFWEHPFTNPISPMYADLKPFAGDHTVWSGLVPDFATEGGRRVYVGYQDKILFSKGVDSLKIDEIDNQPFAADRWSYPDDSKFPSGLDGEQMHTEIGVLAAKALLEPFRKKNERTWGLERESGPMAASLPYTIYSDSYTFRDYARGLAKIGFGSHLWVPEVRDAGSPEELIRRIQLVIFSPYAMINCWYMRTPPWRQINRDLGQKGVEMPSADATTATVRKLFELRMSLIPYLYSAFNEYRNTGTPVVRALVLDNPSDAATADIDDQFMVGPSLMVAPLFDKETQRTVYFPKGDWYDFETGKLIVSASSVRRSVSITCSLDQVPLFVRGNSLIPLAKPMEHVSADTVFDLDVRAYGPHPAPFTLYEDDGVSFGYEKGIQNRFVLAWPHKARRTGRYAGLRYHVEKWTSSEP